MESTELVHYIAKLSIEKKAEQINILDLRSITTIADYFLICNGTTEIHIKAICDHISDNLEDHRIKIWNTEGTQAYHWVLIDLIDVVVHIFLPEYRKYYALEKLWGDAEMIELNDER